MSRLPFSRTLPVVLLACHLTMAPAHAQSSTSSCAWPMIAMVETPGPNDYPTSVLFHFSKPGNSGDAIRIRETTAVGLEKLVRDFPSLVQDSDGWRDLQSRLNCNNRAGDYSYELGVAGDYLVARFSATVEKYWCARVETPCIGTFQDPLRQCSQEANGKLWGARISSASRIALRQDGQGSFKAVVTETTTSSNTSDEQNFVRDLLGAPFLGPIGINAIRRMELSALDTIKNSMRAGFQGKSFQIPGGAALPEFPGYKPRITKLAFMHLPTTGVTATMEREEPEYRENTGCFLAKRLGARSVATVTGGGNGGRSGGGRGCVRGC